MRPALLGSLLFALILALCAGSLSDAASLEECNEIARGSHQALASSCTDEALQRILSLLRERFCERRELCSQLTARQCQLQVRKKTLLLARRLCPPRSSSQRSELIIVDPDGGRSTEFGLIFGASARFLLASSLVASQTKFSLYEMERRSWTLTLEFTPVLDSVPDITRCSGVAVSPDSRFLAVILRDITIGFDNDFDENLQALIYSIDSPSSLTLVDKIVLAIGSGDGELDFNEESNALVIGDPGRSRIQILRLGRSGWEPDTTITERGAPDLGEQLAISDNTVIAGGPNSNYAYIFTRSGSGLYRGRRFRFRLDTPPGQMKEAFGSAVAISGDWAVVADGVLNAFGSSREEPTGAVYAYSRQGSVWSTVGIPLGQGGFDIGSAFGADVFISGDVAVIGERTDIGGRANVYRLSNSSEWVLEERLYPGKVGPRRTGGNGQAVVLTGGELLVGHRDLGFTPSFRPIGQIHSYRIQK